MNFSNTLKKLRQATHTTQEQLANHLSLSPQAISRWENATAMPDMTILRMDLLRTKTKNFTTVNL